MMFYLEAKFVGTNGSCGFIAGSTYNLQVRQAMFGRIIVQPVHGYENKPITDMRVPYVNLMRFLQNWQPLKVKGDYWGG
jgi:hypothetical protein